ncbi:arginine--tRNA ligase [[Clostridium] methylpentosum DSM 5476]|uniref:Arginine--tRNA ligase n=1 Tax=[Clostridium] methylpentosum DSM 5476 TaxID=537013 RepID=C0EBC9_9FIRM|nr:arginine--tRNA ligase [[Clostridium] methylpentosum DSM 5476]MDY3989961.1 arginine--tRNA ligase [Massilioclostridium sp.]
MANRVSDAQTTLRELLTAAAQGAMEKGLLPQAELPAFTIEIPADSSHGDFAANLAMVSARAFKLAPRKIAEILCGELNLNGTFFDRWEIAGPGFINFFLNQSWFGSVVEAVVQEGADYGRSEFGGGKKVMVEFVSANPTGPMHIGNARGGAMGDCLASVLDWAGYDVTKEFYINDAGNQIEKFALSLDVRYQQIYKGEDAVPLPEDAYQGADIKVHAQNFADLYGDKFLDATQQERRKALVDYALPINIANLKTDLAKYRIEYDVWFKESVLHEEGQVQKIVDILTERGLTYEKEGAIWYKSSEYGSEKDDVLVRANGIPTYFAADIAYHYNKFAVRGFDRVINIWGADHHGHVARLKGAMDAVGLDGSKLDVVLMQMVRLMRDGEPVKVSKRSGKSITLVSLLDEVPIDAARFIFNLREANSHLDFDLDLAVEQSSQNPVYYVQYAHARICSILKKLAQEGFSPQEDADFGLLTAPEEIELIRHIARLPGDIVEAAKAYDPARITRYSLDLATLFHKFYNACKVKGDDERLTTARLTLCDAVRTVLENVLSMLKIDAPESM